MERKKKLRVRYRFSIVFFATVLIFGLMFYRYVKSTTLEDVLSQERTITVFKSNTTVGKDNNPSDSGGNPSPENGGSTSPDKIVNPVPETDNSKDEAYLDSCAFVGDSIAYGLGSYNVVPATRVYADVAMTVASAETQKIETASGSTTVSEALQEAKPENIYLIFSASSAAYSSSDEIYRSYSSFLNKLRIAVPDSRVYVISTPPVTDSKEASVISPIKNPDIDDLNEKLLKYCNDNGIHYLDFSAALKNERGKLKNDFAENDGLHFKRSTYTELINYILAHTVG